jgi:hypothetical protein
MSLINDALKKASQTPTPTTPAPTKEPLRVATHTPAPRWPLFVIPPLVAIVFATGTFMVLRGWQSQRTVLARESAVETAPTETKSLPPATTAATPVAPVTTTPAPAPTNTTVAAPAAFPTLKLQGVIWNPRRPSAVINGKSLFVGEKVERAVVTAIEQDAVTVTWNGEERVLTLR